MRGKCEYWGFRALLCYDYFPDKRDWHGGEPVRIVGRCNITQFLQAVRLLGTVCEINHDLIVKDYMRIIKDDYCDHLWELEILYGCPPGTIFAYFDRFDDEVPRVSHIYENIYGVVTFEIKEAPNGK